MSEQNASVIGVVMEDRYRLITEGDPQDLGMAYKAYDLETDRLVDLLVVAPRWGSGQEALNRLRRVEQILTGLSTPGLLPYEHAGLANGEVYLVRPHIEGETLAELLMRNGRLDEETAVDITVRLCETLAPAHRAGLTHGSLSPHCIVLRKTATPTDPSAAEILVLDTGLVPALRPTDAALHRPWGRVPYISPEQASGQGIQPSSDVYVIGALLYEMLIGRPPFRAADEAVLALQHLHQEPPSLQIMDTSIPKALAQIVYNALSKEPSARYRNAGQLAQILRAQAARQPMPVQRTRQEHLVVPSPPAPTAIDTWSSADIYDLEGAGAWSEEQEGVDWMMIALLIAALVAVLGLIPLWRTVYSRYVSASASTSSMLHQTEAEPARSLLADHHGAIWPKRGTKLDAWVVVWYNKVRSRPSVAHLNTDSILAGNLSNCRKEAPSLGVQLTGPGRKL